MCDYRINVKRPTKIYIYEIEKNYLFATHFQNDIRFMNTVDILMLIAKIL